MIRSLIILCLLGLIPFIYGRSAVYREFQSLINTSCEGRCGETGHDNSAPCQCNSFCEQYGDCCSDYDGLCQSCQDRCAIGYDRNLPCQCNTQCPDFNNCCRDYSELCLGTDPSLDSCKDRCGPGTDTDFNCQCNPSCVDFGDCCDDYQEECEESGGSVTDDELLSVTQKLWEADSGRLPRAAYTLDTDGEELFTAVDESYLQTSTYQAFIKLLDNYIANVDIEEPDCPPCDDEIDEFLAKILPTTVMTIAKDFLISNGYISSDSGFRELLVQYWFTRYSRSGGPLGSSGFEHVFVGEIKDGSVSGFHSWVQFYEQEKVNQLEYGSSAGECLPRTIELSMDWLGEPKPITSIMHGVSPEFEMALLTVCFATRRDDPRCGIQLDNHRSDVVVWSFQAPGGVTTIGTAYPTC